MATGSGKSVICSSVIEDIMTDCKAGSAIMAFFYFDFRDLKKQSCHDLMLSLVSQFSTHSSAFHNILHRVYKEHEDGAQEPSDHSLKKCLLEMLRLPGQRPIFIMLDALDQCQGAPGILPPNILSPQFEVLELVQELVELRLQELHICATSRFEADIRSILEPLASQSISLHDEIGQKSVIADYVQSVVNSSTSAAMRKWNADDKTLVIKTLTERADGILWVFYQLKTLQNCQPKNLRQFLNQMPDTLDETYERILKDIEIQQDDALRLLQCLIVAIRPLRVEELAEVLAFDFQASRSGGIPKMREDRRWDDPEEAIPSTCSSLITIVRNGDSRVVQFSHLSVKEHLTSPRLAQSQGDASRFHIDLEAAHTIMAQACLGTLLRLDEHTRNGASGATGSPLVEYAARHWVEHAQFENVSSHVRDGMEDLFDRSKPHFAAWLRVHDIDECWAYFTSGPSPGVGSPLYYAAFCGFHDLAERLIMKDPEQVNAVGGLIVAPLLAALSKRHFSVANLLHRHGAVVDVRDKHNWTPLHRTSFSSGHIDIMRWLLNHGADSNARTNNGQTPLHWAAYYVDLEAVQVLLEYNPDVNSQDSNGDTPLGDISDYISYSTRGKGVDIVRRLLEHGADTNICNNKQSTPLHKVSFWGSLEAARLLLSYGAKVDVKDREGMTPFQVASSKGHQQIAQLLLKHGAVPQS